jgi:hypothetical protein
VVIEFDIVLPIFVLTSPVAGGLFVDKFQTPQAPEGAPLTPDVPEDPLDPDEPLDPLAP